MQTKGWVWIKSRDGTLFFIYVSDLPILCISLGYFVFSIQSPLPPSARRHQLQGPWVPNLITVITSDPQLHRSTDRNKGTNTLKPIHGECSEAVWASCLSKQLQFEKGNQSLFLWASLVSSSFVSCRWCWLETLALGKRVSWCVLKTERFWPAASSPPWASTSGWAWISSVNNDHDRITLVSFTL